MKHLASHNSWSFLRPQKWWMRMLAFTARCQRVNIAGQYHAGARCFDLRIRFIDYAMFITHGAFVYGTLADHYDTLEQLNASGGCYVRVNLDVRTEKALTDMQKSKFRITCEKLLDLFPNVTFFSGDDLYTHTPVYDFDTFGPSLDERYASVSKPRLADDWWPWLYARLHNKKNKEQGTDKDFLMLDFVDL